MYFLDQALVNTKRWLQFNIEPFEDVLMKWRETVEYRRTFLTQYDTKLNDILEQWPIYKQSFGHNLVKKKKMLTYIFLYKFVLSFTY